MRLLYHRDGPTPVKVQLVAGDLVHLGPLEGRRHVVLSDVKGQGGAYSVCAWL